LKIAKHLNFAGTFTRADIPIMIFALQMFLLAVGHGKISLFEFLVVAGMNNASREARD
jgi:hypothetical protein